MLHKNITTSAIHYIQNWSVVDNTARNALSVAAADVGKVCQVTGTSSYYILTDDSPMTWQLIGDVVGPASSTDNAIVRFDGTTGKLVQNSGITIADGASGTLSNTNSGDVTLNASVADIFGLTGQEITADDPAADRLVFWDDSAGKLTHLTAGSGLTITDTTITASGGGGITLGTPVASTSGTTVSFTGIPSGTKRIVVMLDGVSLSGTDVVILQLGDSGGFETTSYESTGGVIVNGASSSVNTNTAGFHIRIGDAAVARTGCYVLELMDSSTNKWICHASGGDFNTQQWFSTGKKSLSAELTQVRLATNGANTFDAGSVNISYQS